SLLSGRRQFTEWGFLEAAIGVPGEEGTDTDVLVWSLTARRTRLLEPVADRPAERVVFMPGTNFTVLQVRPPSGAERGLVLLREVAAAEIDASGTLSTQRSSLDEVAASSLQRALAARGKGTGPVVDLARTARVAATLPGMVTLVVQEAPQGAASVPGGSV
ncbi:MAG: hypothetical protein ACRYF3_10120, partial [Janthinobacterium lividum]